MNEHWRPSAEQDEPRIAEVLKVLRAEDTVARLRRYYDRDSGFAGATFLHLQPSDPTRFTASDLLAVTTLSVAIHPLAIRRILESDEGEVASGHLAQLPKGLDLADSDVSDHASAMSAFYLAVRTMLRAPGRSTSNAWVTASKLCARKRPNLFPVRDTVVAGVLRLTGNYPEDWPAYAAIIGNDEVRSELARVVELATAEASPRSIDVGDPTHLLRHLDVALWMHGISTKGKSEG